MQIAEIFVNFKSLKILKTFNLKVIKLKELLQTVRYTWKECICVYTEKHFTGYKINIQINVAFLYIN